ncbi:MAG: DNA translocase FtsK [bacterium]
MIFCEQITYFLKKGQIMWRKKKNYDRFEIELPQPKRTYAHFKEVYGIGLIALSLFFILAVFSYDPNDPTLFSYVSSHPETSNFAGWIGAHVAAMLLYLFGSAVYIFFACLIVPAALLISGYAEQPGQKVHFLRRSLIFLPCLLLCSTVLCAFYNFDVTRSYPGGLLGSLVARIMFPVLGFFGSVILLWAALWGCLALLLNRSLINEIAVVVRFICIWLWTGITLMFQGIKIIVGAGERVATKGSQKPLDFEHDAPVVHRVAHDSEDKIDKDFWDSVTTSKAGVLKKSVTIKTGHPMGQLIDVLQAIIKIKSGVPSQTFTLPPLSAFCDKLRTQPDEQLSQEFVEQGKKLEEKLQHFGIHGMVTHIKPGPMITMFEYQPEIDSKISKIIALEDDLAMALSAMSIRTIAPIPGKNAVGFEIANKTCQDVLFADVVMTKLFAQHKGALPLVLGVDVVGNPVVENLTSMPHLLIGGTTGSGKSVGLNAMIASLLARRTPDQMKLILVDPKRLEFAPFVDIPHLLFPIITNPMHATTVLKWVVQEMEDRYEKMATSGARNLHEYRHAGHDMPYLVVVIDELADLMIVAGKDVELHIVRIAQMARAAGIHMIVATQRPSVDVVTGLIKVNFPSRVSYRVSSKVDSRTILDQQGAEKLLGRGDMLFKSSTSPHLTRIHGAYISNQEIEKLASLLRSQGIANYLDIDEIMHREHDLGELDEALYPEVVEFLKTVEEVSISLLQRHYRIGFNRSARIIQQLEADGYLAPAQGSKPRKVIRF